MNEKIERLKALIEQHPKRKEAYYLLAENYVDIDDLDGAIEALSKAILIDETFLKAYARLGEILLWQDRKEEAEKIFKEAERNLPNDTDCLYAISNIYKATKDFDKAIKYLKKVLSYDGFNAKVYQDIGEIHLNEDNVKFAQLAFKKALELNPKDIRLYLKLAYTYYLQQNKTRALELLTDGLNLDKENADILYLMCKIYAEMDDDLLLKQFLDRLLLVDPARAKELLPS